MTRHEQLKLMSTLADIISDLQRKGGVTMDEICEVVSNNYPELCELHKDRLFREAISSLSRRVMKRSADSAKSEQFVLPMKLRSLRGQLPANISLPPKSDIDPGTGEITMAEEFVWRPIEEATFSEFGLYLEHLQGSILADQKRYKALNRVRQYLRPHMDNDEHRDDPIGPMLAELAAAEREKAR